MSSAQESPGSFQYAEMPRVTPSGASIPVAVRDVKEKKPQPGLPAVILFTLILFIIIQGPSIFAAKRFATEIEPGKHTNIQALLKDDRFIKSMAIATMASQFLSLLFVLMSISWIVGPDWTRLLAVRKPQGRHVLLAFLGLPAAMILISALGDWLKPNLPKLFDAEQTLAALGRLSWPTVILLIGFAPGLTEELWFRGFFGRGLQARHGPAQAVFFSSLFFGILHLDPRHALLTFLIGGLLHGVYLASRSLLLPILLHVANNTLSIAAIKAPFLQVLDLNIPASEAPWYLYGAALLLVAVVSWAFYRSRTFLENTPNSSLPGWTPSFSSVALPPPDTSTVVQVHPLRPWHWLSVAIAALGLAAALVHTETLLIAKAAAEEARTGAKANLKAMEKMAHMKAETMEVWNELLKDIPPFKRNTAGWYDPNFARFGFRIDFPNAFTRSWATWSRHSTLKLPNGRILDNVEHTSFLNHPTIDLLSLKAVVFDGYVKEARKRDNVHFYIVAKVSIPKQSVTLDEYLLWRQQESSMKPIQSSLRDNFLGKHPCKEAISISKLPDHTPRISITRAIAVNTMSGTQIFLASVETEDYRPDLSDVLRFFGSFGLAE